MNLSFLEDLLKPVGKGFAEADTFMNREMPFGMSWGAPIALGGAAYFGGPALMASLGEGGAAGIGGAEGVGSTAGGGGILESLGGSGGSFAGQETFELPASSYTPEYLNSLAQSQGLYPEDKSIWDIISGNTEKGLYDKESAAKAGGQTVSDMLKKRSQQSALSQLSKSGSAMQQQGQQSPQMQIPQAMMSKGKGVDTISALLSLLQEKKQSKQPRISLI